MLHPPPHTQTPTHHSAAGISVPPPAARELMPLRTFPSRLRNSRVAGLPRETVNLREGGTASWCPSPRLGEGGPASPSHEPLASGAGTHGRATPRVGRPGTGACLEEYPGLLLE